MYFGRIFEMSSPNLGFASHLQEDFWYLGETEYIKISTITNQFFLGFTDTGIYHNILM
jgi:hypothetical protein